MHQATVSEIAVSCLAPRASATNDIALARKGSLGAHDVKHLDLLVDRSSRGVELLLQLPKRVPAPSFSTGLALSSVDSQRRQGTQGTR